MFGLFGRKVSCADLTLGDRRAQLIAQNERKRAESEIPEFKPVIQRTLGVA